MNLARNRNGQIGRHVPGTGLQAKVNLAPIGDHRGSVEISAHSIDEDENYYREKERYENGLLQAKRFEYIAQRNAEEIQYRKRAQEVEAFQRLAAINPMMTKLKTHYAKRAGMGESDIVSDSLLRNPADFSSSGGNSEIVASQHGKRAIAWRADFRDHLIVGNPLTRDGEYGPAVTDYDRYVQGTDVNQWDVVPLHAGAVPERLLSYHSETMDDELPIAGGTMLGRYDGSIAPAGAGYQAMNGLPTAYSAGTRRGIPRGLPGRFNSDQGMGFDWSWGGLSDTLSNIADQTVDQTIDQLPDQLAKELQNAITGGGQVTSQGGGVITVQRPVTGAVNTVSQTIGLPPWAIYSALGLIGIGVTFMLIKAVKS